MALALWALTACTSAGPPVGPRPTLILVSLDGFRWDFLERAASPHLDALIERGVRAEHLIPVFPSKTFPNHYSIVTGLYPARHGIVANNMYDPEFDATFKLSDRGAVGDRRWWHGEPIWVTAERQGLTTAPLFWPGSEAAIGGVRPTHWRPYDGDLPNEARVDLVLDWLDLPPPRRPSFLTLYFSSMDDVAHDHGPDAETEIAATVELLDRLIGRLTAGLAARGLADRVDLVVVSDHGMAATSAERVLFLDDYVDVGLAGVVDWSPVLALRPAPGHLEETYRRLAGAHPHLAVYRRGDLPPRWHYAGHRRIAPIVAVADEGWSISTRRRHARDPRAFDGGQHGYDPALRSMGALFIAAGPSFRRGLVVPPFENVHLYALMCAALGLEPAPNDGRLEEVAGLLRRRPAG